MCDTVVIVQPDKILFAKNSDRDPNEAQGIEWHGQKTHPRGTSLKCTWIEIPQVAETCAVLISRPFWMWGAEMGANEHGVVIGNEAVFTKEPYARAGLTGMDLVRLALERADTAQRACAIITGLLEQHGQGGGCGYENRAFTYHNSFLIADPRGAVVLETAGRAWAVEEVRGVRTISNGLTIPGFAERHSDFLYTRISVCRRRRARTQELAGRCRGVSDLFRLLRDHGEGRTEPHYALINGGMGSVCMHAGGLLAASQTTASWVSELGADGAQHWVTGAAAPCTGLFKPVRADQPIDVGPFPLAEPNDALWWRHERLHRAVMRNPVELTAVFAHERDTVEAEWLSRLPDPQTAWNEGDRLLADWTQRVLACHAGDTRPFWVRRYWEKRSKVLRAQKR